MVPPLVCFVTWNRAGLTAHNLNSLLETVDDFELHIADNCSKDDTWKYVESLKDRRIKEKKRFDANRGVVYAINYVLSQRKKEQYFIVVENDICVKTKDWVTQMMNIMRVFPEVGLLGARIEPLFLAYGIIPEVVTNGAYCYDRFPMVMGSCNCIRPEVFDTLGYWCEETCGADMDMCNRINRYTSFKTGYISDFYIEQPEMIACSQCKLKSQCSVIAKGMTCFELYNRQYTHNVFAQKLAVTLPKFFNEIDSGKRLPYCASIHDPKSRRDHFYDARLAQENFRFFMKNTGDDVGDVSC